MKIKAKRIFSAIPEVMDLHFNVDYSVHVDRAMPGRFIQDTWQKTGRRLGRAMEKVGKAGEVPTKKIIHGKTEKMAA